MKLQVDEINRAVGGFELAQPYYRFYFRLIWLMLVRENRGSSLNTATLASILCKATGYRKKGRKMTIDTAQLKFKSSNFPGSYLMSSSFRPQQGQHTKYPQHSRCVLLVYLSCDLPVLPEGTKDYQVKDI